jgi:hypothetical protein
MSWSPIEWVGMLWSKITWILCWNTLRDN